MTTVEPESCALCGLPPVGEAMVRGRADRADRRYCCSGCATVDEVLAGLPEAERASARLAIGRKIGLPAEQLAALEAEAPGATDTPEPPVTPVAGVVEQRFRVSGLQCPSCAWLVEHTLRHRKGVLSARVDFLTEVGSIELDLRQTSREAALGSLEAVGYRAMELDDEVGGDPERLWLRFAVAAMAAMNTMMLAFVHYAELFGASSGEWRATAGAFGAALAIPAVAYSGAPIFRRAFALLRHRHLGMETLLALGITSSMGLSLLAFVLPGAGFYFEIPTMIVTTALGARLVDRAIRRVAGSKVANLLRPRPMRVRLADRAGAIAGFVDMGSLDEGIKILVPEGEEVPADVEVFGEPVLVSEAVLSGEPRPIAKRAGGTVLAGSVVVEGELRGEVLRRPEASAQAQIGQQILEVIRGQTEQIESLDRVAGRFVLAILALAIGTFLVQGMLGGEGPLSPRAWLPAVAVLVVACPCAFSIAASASMGTAAIRLLSEGVLIRDPVAFQQAGAAEVVVFDKTGTLTAGDMDVHALEWLGEPEQGLLPLVLALEKRSRHPMAAAIRRQLSAEGVEAGGELVEVEERRGLGVVGRDAAGRQIAVGAPALFGAAASARFAGRDDQRSFVVFGPVDAPAGLVVFDDPIRPAAAAAVARLVELGLEVQLLSGDDERAVARCAEALGIEHHEGRALPGVKAQRIEALRAGGRRVVYVGDGINDGPALKAATVGIAMRHGASMALEAADLLAVRDDPSAAVQTIEMGRRHRRVTIENYFWAISYNAVLIPVAALGWLHPTFSAVAMLLSSVTVLANSSRLLGRAKSEGSGVSKEQGSGARDF